MNPIRHRLVVALLLCLAACGGGGGTTPAPDLIVAGVNLTALFAEPSPAEIAAVLADWAGRDTSAQNVIVVATVPLTLGTFDVTVHVVSHTVDGSRHYGAIFVPDGAAVASLPVLVYSHGGDQGVDVDDVLPVVSLLLSDELDDYVLVMPSFRAETLTFEGVDYASDGPPSPWDRDVDDALALVNVVAQITPEADPSRVGVLGFSRGGGVGLLMAIRDPRVEVVVEFFGPTDFFGPFVQQVTEDMLLGQPPNLPGVDWLDDALMQPLKNGQLTIDEVRPEILRRSPVYFADRIPDLQVHHGTADMTVPVGEGERLIEVMTDLGRGPPEFEGYIYEGAGHDPLSMPISIPRAFAFLGRLN